MTNIPGKIQSDTHDEVSLYVSGEKIEQFSNVSMLLSMDNVGAGFSFDVPFFPGTQDYRDLFKPFQYQDTQLYIGDTLKFSGKIESVAPTLTSTSNFLTIQGRSKPSVIVDCNFEKDESKEFLKADLQEIANSVISKFGLESSFPEGAGAIFEKAGPDSPTTKVFDFLKNLARQRKLLMGQTTDGKLLFSRANVGGAPVAELIEGNIGVLLSTANYDGTKRFSKYEVYGQEAGKNDNFAQLLAEISQKPATSTTSQSVTDSEITNRPKAIQGNDTNQGNIEDVAKWALTSDIAASINIPISYEGWHRPDGELWAENEMIIVQAPSLMVYKPFKLLIKSVLFNSSPSQKTVDLTLSIPEAYTGEIPGAFPWE